MSRPLVPHKRLQRLAHPSSLHFHFFPRLMPLPPILRLIPTVAEASAQCLSSRQVSTGKEASQRGQSRYQHLHYHAPWGLFVITGICRIVAHAVFVLKLGHFLSGVSVINNVCLLPLVGKAFFSQPGRAAPVSTSMVQNYPSSPLLFIFSDLGKKVISPRFDE